MNPLGAVAILGAGQTGTMLGLALRASELVADVALFDPDDVRLQESLARGAGDRGLERSDEALTCDVIVFAAPLLHILAMIGELGPRARPGTLLIDTGSAKRVVIAAMRAAVPPEVHAIGGHPMAGTEIPGPAGARPDLLAGATFALCPARDDPEALKRARAFVGATGAKPFEVDATTHDAAVALTSHVPHLLAFALAGAVADAATEPAFSDTVRALISSGFRGATRLAASDPATTAAFLSTNADQVRGALGRFRSALDELAGALDDPRALGSLLAAGRAARAEMAGNGQA